MKNLIAASLIICGFWPPAFANNYIPEGVFSGLSQFTSNQIYLPVDYIKKFPQHIHSLLIHSESEFVNKTQNFCQDFTDVQYVNHLGNESDKVIQDFESSLIKIEVAKCFQNTTVDLVMKIMNSLDFKRTAYSTIQSVEQRTADTTCEFSSAPMLGRSHYCYKTFDSQLNSNSMTSFSINDWFELSETFTVPVYYRESLITTRQIGSQIQLHSISYARGPSLTTLQRLFAKSYIAAAQTDVFNTLENRLIK